jgi:biopolymer transport protein ExbD
MTPLIDVVFNLMIYFLLTMNFSMAPALKLDLPRAGSAKESESKTIIKVEISKDSRIFVDGKEQMLETLDEALKKAGPKAKKGQVAFFVDKGTNFGLAINVMDKLRLCGFLDIAVITERAKES